ncbi:hypothetical protein [Candidatus Chloroploca sp. Khr17]|uniref:CIS tube protein n=1 Tax=Candidatus Chloroploca sp. Khr17 TaxID=2496869 RepID=UPI00101E14EA|nr:hypothetical protein [Candidatus Chloroploca sp. Khr17]
MSDTSNPEQAIITPISQGAGQELEAVTVQFNPASLEYNLRNNIEKKGRGARARQHVSQTTATLATELIFDTTHTGQDVRIETVKIARYLQPYDDTKKIPPTIRFEWGTFVFEGYVESYKETIDFFAAGGVPLRSTLNVTFTSKDKQFDTRSANDGDTANVGQGLSGLDSAVVAPAPDGGEDNPTAGSPADTAAQGGDPGAARMLALANGLESLRFPAGALAVGAGASIGAAAAFSAGASASLGLSAGVSAGIGASASAGFGAGASAGFGASASAGFGAGASAGFGASASAGFGAGASAGFGASAAAGFGAGASAGGGAMFGATASAGVTASAGAFSGLHHTTSVKKTTSLNTNNIIKGSISSNISTDQGASFKVGGQAHLEGSASLSAKVKGNLSAKLQFDA